MPRSTGPLIPRRRFGGEIKRLRESRGETLADIAGTLLISTSKLSRIENGQGELRPRDIRDLLAHFEVSDTPEGARLREWAEQARIPGWWQEGAHHMSARLDTYIGYENAASRIESYVPTVIPGILQTRAYAEEVFRRLAPAWNTAEIQHQVDLRMERQRALRERDEQPLILHIVPETVLHWVVGSAQIMQEQIRLLITSYDDPSFHFHVIPYTAGLFPGMTAGFTVFSFDDQVDPGVAALDLVSSVQFLTDEPKVREHREILLNLERYRLDRDDSLSFLQQFLHASRLRGTP